MGQGVLTVSGDTLARIATQAGTPVWVYSAAAVRARHALLTAALGDVPHRIHYSVKANSSLAVLALVRELGMGVDIVSGGELTRVLRAGFAASAVVFSGVGKQAVELRQAAEADVGLVNLESAGELDTLAGLVAGRRRPLGVGIRVNPDVTTSTHPYTQTGQRGMKFGVPVDQVLELAAAVAEVPGLVLRSVGMHVGSQIADVAPYRRGAAVLRELVHELRSVGPATLESVDIGGGLGIDYGVAPGLDLPAFADLVCQLAADTGLTVLIEPGRFMVGNAGVLLTRVLYVKRTGGRAIVVTDAGMNDLLRPSLYQAHHEVRLVNSGPVALEPDGPVGAGVPDAIVDVVGPNCETGDFLALGRSMAVPGPGDLLAVLGAGAYGFGMSSNYNSRPRAAEVMLDGARYGIIRARETADDLLRGETMAPPWEQL